MKKLSQLFSESFQTNGIGNAFDQQGVTNHYTPIMNIIQGCRNIFGPKYSVIFEPGDDGVSIKLSSSFFIDEKAVNATLFTPIDRYTTLDSFIRLQGLTKRTIVQSGQLMVVYYSPEDIATAQNPVDMEAAKSPVLPDESDVDPTTEELENIAKVIAESETESETNFSELFNDEDKNLSAAMFAEKLKNIVSLPENYYIKATRDSDGNKSIALRKKITLRKAFGKEIEVVKSLMNIYSDDNIWVGAFQEVCNTSEEDKKLIENILNYIKAEKTDDECVYTLHKKVEEPNNSDEPKNEEDNKNKDEYEEEN